MGSGREIESSYRVQTENNRTSIVVRNLNPGVYFFRIEGERKLHEGKFVIL
ncbi:T9SS type A sorting domain-containing protein [candidate division WOR-3 bacterium]|nr:T9SS type A sorting domain-containing protein [candidate division WOR-3 bacterium]